MKNLNNLLIYGFILPSLSNVYLMHLVGERKLDFLVLNTILGSEERLVSQLVEKIERAHLLMILIYPLFLATKILVSSSILDLGFALSNINMSFKKLMLATLTAEYVYLLAHLYDLLFATNELSNPYLPYSDFSLSLIFPLEGFPFFLQYIWYSINLFEILYFFILVYVIDRTSYHKFGYSFSKVLKSYGACYLLWLISIGLLLQSI